MSRGTVGGPLRIWGMPLLLGALTGFGLLAALLGSGVWHGLSWLALLAPVAVAAVYSLRR